ncbi:MAG TPA: endolytic transglycosylase MltG, partial [Candidatus Eisenbacteria bacterium]|nr:endolytic transglycosylase MltG [Candidatus Eisenbacteria bacterium]
MARKVRPFRPRRWALVLLAVAGLAIAWDLLVPAGLFPSHERRELLVERGQSLSHVASELQRVGLIHSTLGFEVLARLMRLDRHIKAGQYSFALGTTVPAILRAFARGMSGLDLVTIPEGLTVLEASVLLAHHLGVPVAAFDSLAHDRQFLDSLDVHAPSLEGYIAPNTYEMLPGTAPETALRTMAMRQREILKREAAGRDSLPLGLGLHQILTLASIVECEAAVDDERPRIARVYLNRLQRGMKLQADPTVAYGMHMPPRSRLFLRQLKFDSPYNTYVVDGLPPGPICNPGEKSIHAVLNPSPPGPELYFVARGEGGRHFFSTTYEQHLANIEHAHSIEAAAAAAAAGPDSVRKVDSLAVKDSVAALAAKAGVRADPAAHAAVEAAHGAVESGAH